MNQMDAFFYFHLLIENTGYHEKRERYTEKKNICKQILKLRQTFAVNLLIAEINIFAKSGTCLGFCLDLLYKQFLINIHRIAIRGVGLGSFSFPVVAYFPLKVSFFFLHQYFACSTSRFSLN